MATESESVRYYTDVMEGYVPQSVSWTGVYRGSIPPECAVGYKRIWMEVEMPSDEQLWPERFEGFHINGLDRGQRVLQIDNVETGTRQPEVRRAVEEEAQEERPRPRRNNRRISSE